MYTLLKYGQKSKRTKKVSKSDERVLILGASTLDGLGAEFLRQYLERGARQIVIVGRRKQALDHVRDTMLKRTEGRGERHPHAQVYVVPTELTDTEGVIKLRDFVMKNLHGLDTLHIVFGVTSILPILGVANVDPYNVNASGQATDFLHASREGLDQIAQTVQHSSDGNLKGTAIVLGAMLPILQTTSANPAVITIGSVAGLIPAPTRAVYCASKSSQHYLIRSVELECEAQAGTPVPGSDMRRTRVNFLLVAPGPIKNSFVATYAVDATTGPRDNRERALEVPDVVQGTLRRVDGEQWGILVIPSHAFVGSLLAQFNATYVPVLLQSRSLNERLTFSRRSWVGRMAHNMYRY